MVTGGSGFIGGHLTEHLDAINLDIKDGNDILTCELPDADIVIHLAAQTSVIGSLDDPFGDAETNILGTIRLAKRYTNSRFIFASSGGCIQERIESPYGLSKFCAEKYIELLCKDYVILRFPNIYGPGSNSVVDKFAMAEGPITVYGDGSSTRDYVHVFDIVRAILESVTWPAGRYSLGSGKRTSLAALAAASGKPVKYAPNRKGEVYHSSVPNTSPWRPVVNVLDYLRQCVT